MPNSSMSPTMRKTSFRERSKGSTGKMNGVLLRCRFRKITASPLNEDFKLNLLYCCSPSKIQTGEKLTDMIKKDISTIPNSCNRTAFFAVQSIIFSCGKARFGCFSYPLAAIYETLILGRDFDLRCSYPCILYAL